MKSLFSVVTEEERITTLKRLRESVSTKTGIDCDDAASISLLSKSATSTVSDRAYISPPSTLRTTCSDS